MNQSRPFPEWKGLQHLWNQCPLYPSTVPYAKSVCALVLSMAESLFLAITFTCSDKPSQVTSTTLNLKPVLSSRILSCVFLWVWNNSDWSIWKWRHRSNQLDQIKTWESRDGSVAFQDPVGIGWAPLALYMMSSDTNCCNARLTLYSWASRPPEAWAK